jgi:hypothetical protein
MKKIYTLMVLIGGLVVLSGFNLKNTIVPRDEITGDYQFALHVGNVHE